MRDRELLIELLATIKGRVQGVGFRAKAKQLADALKLTGFVRNLINGDVEICAQGIPNKPQKLAFRRFQSAANRFPRRGSYWSILALFAGIDFRQLSIPPEGQFLRFIGYKRDELEQFLSQLRLKFPPEYIDSIESDFHPVSQIISDFKIVHH